LIRQHSGARVVPETASQIRRTDCGIGHHPAQLFDQAFLLFQRQPAGIMPEATNFLWRGACGCVLGNFCHFLAIFLGGAFLQADLALLIYASKPVADHSVLRQDMKPKPKG
jgi:hypothetical protein